MKRKVPSWIKSKSDYILYMKKQDEMNKKLVNKRKPLCEPWRYKKKEWLKEVNKLYGHIRFLRKLKEFNDFHGQNSKTIKKQINEYRKSLDETQKIFLSACKREEEKIRKNKKLSPEEKDSKLFGIINKTANLIRYYIKYYDQKIKYLEKKLNLISCINQIPKYIKDYEQKLLHGLCHLHLNEETVKVYLDKYKEICNYPTQNNLFKKSKIEK